MAKDGMFFLLILGRVSGLAVEGSSLQQIFFFILTTRCTTLVIGLTGKSICSSFQNAAMGFCNVIVSPVLVSLQLCSSIASGYSW